MSSRPQQSAPTLQAVLILHAEIYRGRTGISHERWAEMLDARYCALVDIDHRSLPAPDLAQVEKADEYRKLLKAWDQTVRRYQNGTLNFPVELMEAWINALDEPYHWDCNREIAQRRGLVGAQRYDHSAEGDHRAWGDTLQHFGQLTQRMGEILQDGSINERDLPNLPHALQQLDAMEADIASLRHQIQRVLGSEETTADPVRRVK